MPHEIPRSHPADRLAPRKKIKYCKKCLQPDTRPSIQFDDGGICPACRFAETYDSIDWEQRRGELDKIIAYGKRNSSSGYECVIGVSGGKDSIRQVMFTKDEMGLTPLLVCLSPPPEHVSSRGARNLENIIGLGFDTIVVTPAPLLWKKMMREGFLRFGNYQKSTEMALYSSAPKVAAAYHIPIIFLGENPAITVGELGVGSTGGSAQKMKSCHTLEGGPLSVSPGNVSEACLFWYHYSSAEEMDLGDINVYYLGYYVKGFAKKSNAEFAISKGMETRDEKPDEIGCITGHEALDDDFDILNQMIKFVKFGFGKVTDQVCEEIRLGTMSREEAVDLVRKFDGKCSAKIIQSFCEYLEISVEEFWEVVEGFRNHELWRKSAVGEWELSVNFDNQTRQLA